MIFRSILIYVYILFKKRKAEAFLFLFFHLCQRNAWSLIKPVRSGRLTLPTVPASSVSTVIS